MPWFGGIYSLTGGSNTSKPVVRNWHLGDYDWGYEADYDGNNKLVGRENDCDLPGIYFRRFWDLGKDPAYATLMISLWYPALMSAVLPLLWTTRKSYIVYRKFRLFSPGPPTPISSAPANGRAPRRKNASI